MCDDGRLDYQWLNRQRPRRGAARPPGGQLGAVDWDVAIRAAATLLGGKLVWSRWSVADALE